jgi:hypothetical protein
VKSGKLVGAQVAVRWPDDEGGWVQATVKAERMYRGVQQRTNNYDIVYTDNVSKIYRLPLFPHNYSMSKTAPVGSWVHLVPICD